MATLNWALACSNYSESIDGKPILIGVLDTFTSLGIPANISKFLVVSSWKGEVWETLELTIDLLPPSKNCISEPSKFNMPFMKRSIQVSATFPDLIFTEEGIHNVRLISGGRVVHTVKLFFKIVKQ